VCVCGVVWCGVDSKDQAKQSKVQNDEIGMGKKNIQGEAVV
jgi:hypothetical protein